MCRRFFKEKYLYVKECEKSKGRKDALTSKSIPYWISSVVAVKDKISEAIAFNTTNEMQR